MTTIVNGTGGRGSKLIRTSYPEIEPETIALVVEESNVSNVIKEGIDV